jgi:hypothetical protein
VPDAAEGVSVAQIGDRVRLEWRSPARNRDGTTENLDLREARVLRRVLDLDALVKAQTHPAASETKTETGPKTAEAAPATQAAEPPTVETPEPSPAENPPAETGEARPQPEGGPPTPAEEASRDEKQLPQVTFPPFEGEAVVVTTLPSAEPGAVVHYEEAVDPAWIGKRVEYAVVYANAKKRVGPVSARVLIDPVSPLVPPGAPSAEVGDGFVSLTWSALERGEAEAEAETETDFGYLVFRRSGSPSASAENEHEYPASPLDEKPVSGAAYEDRTIVFGAPICYAIAAVRLPPPPPPAAAGDEVKTETGAAPPPGNIVPVVPPIAKFPRIQSPLSDEVCLTPEDHFPPPAPTGLVAVPSPDGILLTWRAVEARDLRAYRVYRRSSASSALQLLAEVETTTYTDRDAPAGEARSYVVTAIDGAPGTNESSKSEVATATRPQ